MGAATALREQDSCLNFFYHYNQGACPIQGKVMFIWSCLISELMHLIQLYFITASNFSWYKLLAVRFISVEISEYSNFVYSVTSKLSKKEVWRNNAKEKPPDLSKASI